MFFHTWSRGRQPFVEKILMSTERPCHFAKFQKCIFEVWFYTYFFLFSYMYRAPGQGQTTPCGQNFYFNIYHSGHLLQVSSIKWLSNSFSPYKSIRDQIWPCCKIGQGQPRIIIWTNYDGPQSPMLHTEPQGHWPFGSLKGFYHIWAWQPSWSCDPDPTNKLLFPHPTEAPFEILLWQAKQFWRRRSLKMVDDRPWLYYKLTNEPKACLGNGQLVRRGCTIESQFDLSRCIIWHV